MSLDRAVLVRALYSLPGLSKLCKNEGLNLSDEGNRIVMCHILSKIGVTVGQKIAQRLVQQGDNGWGDEDFEVEAILDHVISEQFILLVQDKLWYCSSSSPRWLQDPLVTLAKNMQLIFTSKTKSFTGVEYFLIKWKGWSNVFNSWEPRSNLGCEELVHKFLVSDRRHSWQSDVVAAANDPQMKKRRIEEMVDQLLTLDPQMTADSFINLYEQLDSSKMQSLRSPVNGAPPKRRRLVGELKNNKRTKAYKLHAEEVQIALKNWEKHLNSINTDPAPIFVENNVDLEGPPQMVNFRYINDYLAGEGVDLAVDEDRVVGCECSSCIREKSQCCAHDANAEFAYYANKMVRVPPGSPIYECNMKCRCGPECPNRVVQLGRKHRVCIFRTANNRGWGVKAMQRIKKGSFVMEYVGEVITNEEAERRGRMYDANGMTYLLDLDFVHDSEFLFTVDAGIYGNESHFVNHSCDPNMALYCVYINNLDPRLPRVALFATRNIDKGEELTFDYRMTGDTTEQAHAAADGETETKLVGASESGSIADAEVTFMAVPGTPTTGNVADKTPVPMKCALPPSPPMDINNQVSAPTLDVLDAENLLRESDSDSAGYASCSSSMMDETMPDDASSVAQQPLSAASKYRLRCQCGAKNCRGYLYS